MKFNIPNNTTIIGIFACILQLFACGGNEEVETAFSQNVEETLACMEELMSTSNTSNFFKSDLQKERFKIVHISDAHISRSSADNQPKSPANLKQAVEFANLDKARINAMVATGDFINAKATDDKSTAITYYEGFVNNYYTIKNAIPSFVCTGNHDANMLSESSDGYLSKSDIHSLLFNKQNYAISQPTGENYYYADIKDSQGNTFRIIGLDNTDQEAFDYNTLNAVCFTQKQIDWLVNTALKENMTDKHHVIILNHHPLQEYSKDGSTYMSSGYHLYGPTMIPAIVNAFIQRKTLVKTYKSTYKPMSEIAVNADFTTAKGEFICYMGGHTHTPASFEVDCGEENAPKQIMLLANTMTPNLQNNKFGTIERVAESRTSNSFSIYSIDTDEKKIYITYFGARKGASIENVSYQ